MNNPLHVKIIGTGKPLIMLHGWGWHSGIWEPLVPQLAESFQLFLVDLPGFGKSPELNFSYHIEEVTQKIFHAVPDKANWLGWSLGGMIAWWVAAYYPERVSQLITLASSPKFVAEPNWPGVTPYVLNRFKQLLFEDPKKTLLDFLELQLRGSMNYVEQVNSLKNVLFSPGNIPTQETLVKSLALLSRIDLRKNLEKVQCQSLHIFGSNDTLVSSHIAELIQPSLLHGKSEVIKRTGHMPFLTHSEKILSLVKQFILS